MPDAKSQQSASHVGVALPWWHGTSHGSVETSSGCGCHSSTVSHSSEPVIDCDWSQCPVTLRPHLAHAVRPSRSRRRHLSLPLPLDLPPIPPLPPLPLFPSPFQLPPRCLAPRICTATKITVALWYARARICTQTQTQTHRRTHTLSHTGGYQDARLEQEGQLLLLLRRPDEHLEPSPRAARPAPGPRPCPTTPTAARDRPPAALAAAVIFRDGWKCTVKLAFEPACPPCSGGPSQASDKQQPALPGRCRPAEAVFGVPCPSLASAKRWPHVPGLVAG